MYVRKEFNTFSLKCLFELEVKQESRGKAGCQGRDLLLVLLVCARAEENPGSLNSRPSSPVLNTVAVMEDSL